MQITVKSKVARQALTALEIAAFIVTAVWISKIYISTRLAEGNSVQDLQRGLELDPGNSELHLRLGRVFQYSLGDNNPEGALEQFKRATALNPYDARAWIELARARELKGDLAEAEAYLRRADLVAPNLTSAQWSVANSFLLDGNVDEAFRHFERVLEGTSQYNRIIFSMAWKASGNGRKILDELIPHQLGCELDYLNYLLAQSNYSEAQNVWERILASPETFSPVQVSGYIDLLIRAHRPAEAYQVWNGLRTKRLISLRESDENLLLNSDLEEEPLNMGFDWRLIPAEGLYSGLDPMTYHSPSHALLIEFEGKQNVDYRNFYQYVIVDPGETYRLRAFMKTQDITTDSGPSLEVRDAYNPNVLEKLSPGLLGNTVGWTPVTLDFTVPPETQLIIVGVARLPSRKFDSLIAGKVWVDDFTLTPLAGNRK